MLQRVRRLRRGGAPRSRARTAAGGAVSDIPLVTLLQDIRRLRDQRTRGEIGTAEYARRRSELLALL